MVPGPRHRVGHCSATTDRAGSSPDLRRAEVRAPQTPPERLIGRLKERRRLVARHEKKASHYKAILLWAFVREYLKR
jgi:hypothetical protein